MLTLTGLSTSPPPPSSSTRRSTKLVGIVSLLSTALVLLVLFNRRPESLDDLLSASQIGLGVVDVRGLNRFGNGSDDYEKTYAAALLSLGCLTTPGCFRSVRCRTGTPRKVQRKKKWEEQSFCVDDLRAASVAAASKNTSCLVYSFGIHTSWEWEEKVARMFGCDVHAFDPTMDHKTDLAPGVTFHKLGLQAEGTDMAATHAQEYDAIDPNLLLPLDGIMERLGHVGRTIDVLMMDCEGCEWGVLREMVCNGGSKAVNQIVVEMHFQRDLGLENENDVLMAGEVAGCLQRERWGIASIEVSGSAMQDMHYAPGVLKVLRAPSTLVNLALQRTPDDEPLPEELLEDLATKRRTSYEEAAKIWDKYGNDRNKWPNDVVEYFRAFETRGRLANDAYRKVYRERVKYDEHFRINEKEWIPPVGKVAR